MLRSIAPERAVSLLYMAAQREAGDVAPAEAGGEWDAAAGTDPVAAKLRDWRQSRWSGGLNDRQQ